MKVLAERYGSEGYKPICCPEYPNDDVSCVSGGGGSMCGCCFGGRDISRTHGIILCSGGLVPAEIEEETHDRT